MKRKTANIMVGLMVIISSLATVVMPTRGLAQDTDADSGATEAVASYTDPAEIQEQYDVIVIGAGGGGMAAALAANESGANVVVFEKMPIAGGNTLKASAGMNASQTKFQEEQGIEDSNEVFFEETMAGGHDTNNEELVRFLVDNSAGAIDWLDSMGITLNNLTTTGGMSVERTHRPEDGSAVGEYLVDGLLHNIVEQEIPIFVNAEVTSLTQDGDTVNGVTVMMDGEEKTIAADAVIIASGGFGANLDMVTELNPDLEGFVTTNHEGATGDGIDMASEVGGDTVDMDQIQIHPTVEQETAYLITEAVRGEGAILVNGEGERFTNELDTRDMVSAAILELPEQSAYVVFDQALRERVPAIDQYDSMDLVLEGESAEALAEQIGVPAENLQATLNTWNEAVASGEDTEFGRTTGMDEPLETPSFYAIQIAPGIHHTMGGVRINTNAQVLNTNGEAIPGLYAAGEATGGVHGSNRIGGNAVADIIVYGRQAGVQSAQYVAE